MITFSTGLQSLLDTATTKADWIQKLITSLGSTRTITCKRATTSTDVWGTGSTFWSANLVGNFQYTSLYIGSFGKIGSITSQLTADISTGYSILRITGSNGEWMQGTLSLTTGTGDFKLRINPSVSSGFGFSPTFKVVAPQNLPEVIVVPPSGSNFTNITVFNTSNVTQTSVPYSATVAPLMGKCPSGYSLYSNADTTMRCAVLGRHTDGSIALAIVSGSVTVAANSSTSISIYAGIEGSTTTLTTSAISAKITSINVDFAGTYGIGTYTNFTSPERIWWSNANTICARYRMPAPNPGTTQLEAIIDIQAWSDRAVVEVVIENSKMVSAAPVRPGVANYAQATVTVNGTLIATGNATGVAAETGHNSFRAWHCRTWVGAGDPKLVAHQDVADLQQHPLLFKMDQACTTDLSGYASDTYVQWGFGRQRDAYMGNGGDHPSIGPLTQWDARWLQSGDPRVANSVDIQALTILHWNINHREINTGRVPTHVEVDGKSINGSDTQAWPQQTNSANALQWELMHHPAVGLAAFLARPSPVFIEITQKIAIWNAMWPGTYDNGMAQPTGIFRGGSCPTRGRAWALRSLAHAIFLTPDNLAPGQPDPWKPAAKISLAKNLVYLDGYRTHVKSKLNSVWEGDPDYPQMPPYNAPPVGQCFAIAGWMYDYLIVEMHKIASMRFLTGNDQVVADTVADWMAGFRVRWVNEQPNGAWRYVPYVTTIGRSPTTIDMPDNWSQIRAYAMLDIPSSVAGVFVTVATSDNNTYDSFGLQQRAGSLYPSYMWSALVVAVERGVPGSRAAWNTVLTNITDLTYWRTGFGDEPRWGNSPRKIGENYGLISTTAGALSAGNSVDITASTNVVAMTDLSSPDAPLAVGWLHGDGLGRVLTNWPGTWTWVPQLKRVISDGQTNGWSSENPPAHNKRVNWDSLTGLFSAEWGNPPSAVSHQWGGNLTYPTPDNNTWRWARTGSSLYRRPLSGSPWIYVGDTGVLGSLTESNAVPTMAYHPRLGKMGSLILVGTGGRVVRFDLNTYWSTNAGASTANTSSVLATACSGVNGPELICSYHPGIDAVIFGGGGTSGAGVALYKVDASGTVSALTLTAPAGITNISAQNNNVLVPDPQNRALAWLYDKTLTNKCWKLDLTNGTYTDSGMNLSSIGGYSCFAVVPESGVHVAFDGGNGRINSTTSDSKVVLFKPPGIVASLPPTSTE